MNTTQSPEYLAHLADGLAVIANWEKCPRCSGSGEIGKRTRGEREAPGPVPDDARGWYAVKCPDCNGTGFFVSEDEDEEGQP